MPFVPKDVQTAIKQDIKKFVTALLVLSSVSADVAKEAVRIDLFFEETDPAKRALRNSAYQLTATRSHDSAIGIDDRNTLVLTVPDAAVRHNAVLTL